MRGINRSRRGLLFGPREAGCWEFVLGLGWLCTLVTVLLAWLSGNSALRQIAGTFFCIALSTTLLLLSLAQSCWVSERWPSIPDVCYQVSGWLLIASLFSPFLAGLTGQVWIARWGMLYLLGMVALLLLSLLLRIVLSIWERASGK
ncbi:hypothetical protein IV102_30715 [bacterium]|nr:hypothetical protein [bacterium]